MLSSFWLFSGMLKFCHNKPHYAFVPSLMVKTPAFMSLCKLLSDALGVPEMSPPTADEQFGLEVNLGTCIHEPQFIYSKGSGMKRKVGESLGEPIPLPARVFISLVKVNKFGKQRFCFRIEDAEEAAATTKASNPEAKSSYCIPRIWKKHDEGFL